MSGDGTQGGGSTAPQQGAQMAPFMPGQQDALSQQLSAGFGQSPGDISAWLDQVHKPTQNTGQTPTQNPGGSTGNSGGMPALPKNGGSLKDMEQWIQGIMSGIQSQMPPIFQQYGQGLQQLHGMGVPADLQALLSKFQR